MAEMVRRWMWVFLRVEWEVVRKMREGQRPRRMDNDGGDPTYEEEEFELQEPTEGEYDAR
jgi:hypothetical protein